MISTKTAHTKNVQPKIRKYRAFDDYVLHYRHWRPEEQPRARIVYLHGIQSHGGWFERSCRYLCQAGYELFFLDRRGSGLNQRDRGHAESWRQLVDDVVRLLRMLRNDGGRTPSAGAQEVWRGNQWREPPANCPTILLAVSWGAKLATAIPQEGDGLIQGLGLLYPGIGSRVRPRWHQALLLRAACRLGFGRYRLPIPLDDPALFTANPKWQQFIADDPLSLRKATLSLLKASCDLDCQIPFLAERIRVPVLMLLAGRDRLIDNAFCRRFFERLAAPEKTLIEYPQAQHTLEFEPSPESFLEDLRDWIDSIAAGRTTGSLAAR